METSEITHVRNHTLPIKTIYLTDTSPQHIHQLILSSNPNNIVIYAILDLTDIQSLESPAWFRKIRCEMKRHNLILIGVQQPQLNLEICKALYIPTINITPPTQPLIQTQHNTHILKPIRSGQQVFAQHGSLIAGSHVSAGAEIAAIDDIHIYGSCSGKVLAGVNGNTSAKIYLSRGFPELISIAGKTLHSDSLTPIEKPSVYMINNGQLKLVQL